MIREDFKKVFDVVREQVEKALQGKTNSGPKTFDEFRNKVKDSKYFIFIKVDISWGEGIVLCVSSLPFPPTLPDLFHLS